MGGGGGGVRGGPGAKVIVRERVRGSEGAASE